MKGARETGPPFLMRAKMSADSLAALVRTIPDFPKPGIQFRDITTLLADAAGLAELVERMAAAARPLDPAFIAGIEARGFILGAALAHADRQSTRLNSSH